MRVKDTLLRKHLNRLRSSPSETLLLDGGTGEEIFLRGVPDDRKIWSATALVHDEYHSVVEEVHRSFIASGSQCITTNSYGVTPGVGFHSGDIKRLSAIAGQIAHRASIKERQSCGSTENALVLGSLGPQVESYRPDLIMEHEDGVAAFHVLIESLYPYVDMYIVETSSTTKESFQAIEALSIFYHKRAKENNMVKPKQPLLVSFALRSDGKIRSG